MCSSYMPVVYARRICQSYMQYVKHSTGARAYSWQVRSVQLCSSGDDGELGGPEWHSLTDSSPAYLSIR